MSEKQDKKQELKALMRQAIALGSYVVFPMMAGLAGVATPLIKLLLTDTWLPCVPYMQVYCISFAFWPIHSCNLQAINAMGRSDIYLKLEIIKKSYGLLALIIAVVFFKSPLAIAMTGAITAFLSFFVNAFPNSKLIGYSYFEQVRDILPALLAALTMCGVVLLVGLLPINTGLLLILQILAGITTYLLISVIFKFKSFYFLLNVVRNFKSKGE